MIDELTTIGRDVNERRRLAEEWGIAQFHFHDEIDSTQDFLRAMADAGAPSWTLAVADHQRSGRGQGGRIWQGAAGSSLMFSILLRIEPLAGAALIPIRTGLAIARALDRYLEGGTCTMLKWPNDLIVAGGKIGGVLCEAQMRGSEGAVIVGVGMNVNVFTMELDRERELPAGFLAPYLLSGTTRLDLLEAIARSLRAAPSFGDDLLSDVEMRDYAGRDWLRGRRLAEPVTGVASGITNEGQLRVATNGSFTNVVSGRVKLGEG